MRTPGNLLVFFKLMQNDKAFQKMLCRIKRGGGGGERERQKQGAGEGEGEEEEKKKKKTWRSKQIYLAQSAAMCTWTDK